MSVFQIIALLLTLSALFSYLNYCFIKLPTTVGVMLIALIASLVLLPLQLGRRPLPGGSAADAGFGDRRLRTGQCYRH